MKPRVSGLQLRDLGLQHVAFVSPSSLSVKASSSRSSFLGFLHAVTRFTQSEAEKFEARSSNPRSAAYLDVEIPC